MGIYITNFAATAELATASGMTDGSFGKPHVSLTRDNRKLHFFRYDPYNGHDYVVIGGLKWATMNVGATAITDTGLYFQWGDTQGYAASQCGSGDGQKYFGWQDYKYGNGTSKPGATGMTKYNSTDGLTIFEASDDAASVNFGGNWRMPTKAEFEALGAAVNTAWTNDYQSTGAKGLICTAKDGSGAQLFFPAGGLCESGSVLAVGNRSYYWSRSLYESNVTYAYNLYANNSSCSIGDINRNNGFLVRGVVG